MNSALQPYSVLLLLPDMGYDVLNSEALYKPKNVALHQSTLNIASSQLAIEALTGQKMSRWCPTFSGCGGPFWALLWGPYSSEHVLNPHRA